MSTTGKFFSEIVRENFAIGRILCAICYRYPRCNAISLVRVYNAIMPAYCHDIAFGAFAREMPRIDTTEGLFRAAFAIARHEHPAADVEQAEATIAELAETVRRRVHSQSVEAKLAHLHDVLFDVVGFTGNVDDYYNPANSYLPEVLRTHAACRSRSCSSTNAWRRRGTYRARHQFAGAFSGGRAISESRSMRCW